MKKQKAFTLVEIIIAMFLMMVVILSLFMLNQNANKSSMDSYYEMLCFSLAREPIEVFRGFGYKTVLNIINDSSNVPLAYRNSINKYADIVVDPNGGEKDYPFLYPVEASNFKRCIELKPMSKNGINYINIVVKIAPIGTSKAENWLRKVVTLESNIMESKEW
jgi:type II secretory pathway pseudopilin PulG